jgi:hypothetical protein
MPIDVFGDFLQLKERSRSALLLDELVVDTALRNEDIHFRLFVVSDRQ